MKNILILGAASLAMAACSSGGDADKDGDGNVTAKEAAAEMASGGAIKMEPGEYETKITFTEFDAPGIPESARGMVQAQMAKGMTVKSCITKEQVENPGAEMFGQDKDSSCNLDKFDRSGNKMSVSMSCNPTSGMKMVNNMEGTFGKDSYSMAIDQKISGGPGGNVTMKGNIEAKRIGACPQ